MRFKKFWLAALLIIAGSGFFALGRGRTPVPESTTTASALRLEVDLSTRQLSLIQDGETIGTYSVAIGKPSYPTPKGSYSIRRIIWNPRWVPPDSPWAKNRKATPPGDPKNPMGKVKIFFSEPDYYIHGTKYTDSLGEAESHGCLRMRNSDVVEVAQKVMAAGGKPVPESWVRRMINRVRSTHEVRLETGVPITIRG